MFEHHLKLRWTWLGALLIAPTFVAAKCSDEPLPMGSADGGSGGSAGSGTAAGSGGSSPVVCPASACGPQLGIANYTCADGSIAGPTNRCLQNANDSCSWEIRSCPSMGGSGGPNAGGSGGADPCADQALPDCKACSDGAAPLDNCGDPCKVAADSCSTPIGDSRTCINGVWECAVHEPLGAGCNLVCRDPGSGGGGSGGSGNSGGEGNAGGVGNAGGSGGADCAALLSDVNAKLAAAQACNPAAAKPTPECQGTIEGSCCPVAVESASSTAPANQAYLDALHTYKQACHYACPAIACFTPTLGNCVANTTSSSTGTCGG